MTGNLDSFPRAQLLIRLAEHRRVLGTKLAEFLGVVDALGRLEAFQLDDLLLQAGERFLKLKDMPHRIAPALGRRCGGMGNGGLIFNG
jgi:hypothetical protein